MKIRDLPVGTRQRLGFSMIFVFLTAVAAFSIERMATLRNELDTVNDIWIQRMRVLSEFGANAAALHNSLLQYAISNSSEGRQRQQARALLFVEEIIREDSTYEALKTESIRRGLYTDREGELYDEFLQDWDRYQGAVIDVIQLAEQRRGDEGLNLLQLDAQRFYEAFNATLQELIVLNRTEVATAAARARQTFTKTRNQIVLFLVGAFLISLAIAAWLVRSITQPVSRLVEASRALALGDLTAKVPIDRNDELGRLSRSFNWMAKSLRESRDKTAAQADELRLQNKNLEETLEKLRSTQQQLIISEKMASLGNLTAGIAHEIKNPLNFVNNFATLSTGLADDIVADLTSSPNERVQDILPDVREALDDLKLNATKIAEHGKRADSIVTSMLAHSRGKSGERSITDINRLVGDYLNLAFHGVRARKPDFAAEIEKDLDPAAGEVLVDPQEIGRVLLNLIDNAFFVVDQRVHAPDVPNDYQPRVAVQTRRVDDAVEIRVKDNGGGIPENVRPRIFEPFFTTKPTGAGTGLGLSLSYEIVTQGHGGEMRFETVAGDGTEFVVRIPAKA